MVTVYIEQSIKEQKHNKLATLNHNQQENSNLIMPFLVQNDKMIKRPNYTNKGILLKKEAFFPNTAAHIPQIHKALCLWS